MQENKIFNFIKSKTAAAIIASLFIVALLIIAFNLGAFVGYRKAEFSYAWGENYHRNFAGPKGGFLREFEKDFLGRDFMESHGVFGSIIEIKDSELIIKGKDNIEKIVSVNEQTDIRRFRDNIELKDLSTDELVVVIGQPNDEGKIEAKFIRAMPQPPSSKLPLTFKVRYGK